MKSFPKRLLLFFSALAGCAVCATALTAVVEYKPWGVPDARRDEYDAKLAALDRRDALHARFAEAARPIAATPEVSHSIGFQDPASKGSYPFEIRNSGTEALRLEVDSCNHCDVQLDSPEIQPGTSTFATLAWTTPEEPGDFQRTVTLKTNDPLKDSIELKISGVTKLALSIPDAASFAASDPAQRTEASFVVHSQIWNAFKIVDVTSDLEIFDWYAEPIELSDPSLKEAHATSAWRVRIWTTVMDYGHFTGSVKVSIETGDGELNQHSLNVNGRVRPPIIFHSPELHMTDGLDVGTLFSGKERQFHILVRLRGELDRKIEVLDMQPPELKASLTSLATPGNWRLTLTVPADCPMVVFNIPEQHGYVEVGDPDDRHFKNWFPVHGAVVPAPR